MRKFATCRVRIMLDLNGGTSSQAVRVVGENSVARSFRLWSSADKHVDQ